MKVKAVKMGKGYVLLTKETIKKGDLYLKDGFFEQAKVDKEVPVKDYIKLLGSEVRYLYPVSPFVAPWNPPISINLDDIEKIVQLARASTYPIGLDTEEFLHTNEQILEKFNQPREYLVDVEMEYQDLEGNWYPYTDTMEEILRKDIYLERLRPKLSEDKHIIINSHCRLAL